MYRGRFNTAKSLLYISDILHFSKEIPISQILNFTKKRIEEKEVLESYIIKITKKINELKKYKMKKNKKYEDYQKLQKSCPKSIHYFL